MIVWDAAKRRANLVKHGFDFAPFQDGFDFAAAREFEDDMSRTGRIRFALVGRLRGVPVVVAILSRLGREALSIVSLRWASVEERRLHGF